MDEPEAGIDLLDDGEKLISLKLENPYSDHEEQLRNLVSSWTELKPDVCLITEVAVRIIVTFTYILHCRIINESSHRRFSSRSTAGSSVLS